MPHCGPLYLWSPPHFTLDFRLMAWGASRRPNFPKFQLAYQARNSSGPSQCKCPWCTTHTTLAPPQGTLRSFHDSPPLPPKSARRRNYCPFSFTWQLFGSHLGLYWCFQNDTPDRKWNLHTRIWYTENDQDKSSLISPHLRTLCDSLWSLLADRYTTSNKATHHKLLSQISTKHCNTPSVPRSSVYVLATANTKDIFTNSDYIWIVTVIRVAFRKLLNTFWFIALTSTVKGQN